MRYTLFKQQQLNCDLETAWNFFSSPLNLAKITPKDLGFNILTNHKDLEKIYTGMIIDYKVSPLLGIPMHWQTRIEDVNLNHSFVDTQKKGPYKYWRHYHEFIEKDGGILMTDNVEYELPLGFLGDIANKIIVRSKLEEIFSYRFKVLEQMFNTKK